jgi:hypothetical protein
MTQGVAHTRSRTFDDTRHRHGWVEGSKQSTLLAADNGDNTGSVSRRTPDPHMHKTLHTNAANPASRIHKARRAVQPKHQAQPAKKLNMNNQTWLV